METPMQQLIAELTKTKNKLVDDYENSESNEEKLKYSNQIIGILQSMSAAKKHPPKEQEAIEQAYDTGAIEMYDIDATARNYFNQTYKETQNKQ